ncbi:PREDICTED: (-)-alpha-terpineol synthase-like [Ipomoea nil]|uniref:(-)-alpha-terpineol synthase-like n=1 Tax=Ipomoea nil TaxID=35883 RepID=UPI00090151C7|nr:PREDICTED: (-)-alpha-terpineol synthase-like [Ipomoea nil]
MNGSTWYTERSPQKLVGRIHDAGQLADLSTKLDNVVSLVQKLAQVTIQNPNIILLCLQEHTVLPSEHIVVPSKCILFCLRVHIVKHLSREDMKGILSLYEATYQCMEGESIMEAAQRFCTKNLREIQNMNVILDQDLVDHALEMPLYWRMQRFEARWFISVYEKRHNMNPVLLDFAKLDYNMVQAKYLEELKQMSR